MSCALYTGNVYIVSHFYFPEAFLQVKKLMEKTYSETEQNMSEKQGKIHYTQAKIYREVVTTCF
jgi:hypothetical protein